VGTSGLQVPLFGSGDIGASRPGSGLSLSEFTSDIQAIISNEVSCDLNDVKNAVIGYVANSNGTSGGMNSVNRLRNKMLLAISNVVDGNENYMRNLIQVALANNANVTDLTNQMTGFIINNIRGNRNLVSSIIQATLFNGGNYEDIKNNLTAVIAVDVEGNTNAVQSLIQMAVGNNSTLTDVTGFYESIVIADIRGDANVVTSIISLAAANNADLQNFKANVSSILATTIDGDSNIVNSIADIAIGNDWDMSPVQKKDFLANVSAIIVTDIAGNGNLVSSIAKLSAGNRAMLNDVQVSITGIISNLLQGDGNSVTNSIGVSVLDGRVPQNGVIGSPRAATVSARDVSAKVDAIIANNIRGNANNIDNRIDINVGSSGGRASVASQNRPSIFQYGV
jgi:hypothetical protein